MARRLKKLVVDKISILLGPNPATEIPLLVLKSDEGTELSELYKATFGEEFDFSKPISLEDAKDCFRIIKSYLPDGVPDEIEDVWKLLSQLLIKHVGGDILKGEIMEEKKENNDSWPSVMIPADIAMRTIEKSEPEEEALLEEEEDEFLDPLERQLNKVNERLDRMEQGEKLVVDNWPSVYLPTWRKAEKVEPLPVKKEDPNEKEIPQKKSIDKQGDKDIIVEKEDDEIEDLYPSVGTPMELFGVVPKG